VSDIKNGRGGVLQEEKRLCRRTKKFCGGHKKGAAPPPKGGGAPKFVGAAKEFLALHKPPCEQGPPNVAPGKFWRKP